MEIQRNAKKFYKKHKPVKACKGSTAPELARGLEPLTFGLQIRCSTN